MGRLRNIPGADEALAKSSYVIDDAAGLRGHWQEAFAMPQPLYAELGMGKGQFITQMAHMLPDKNFVGVERYSSVLLRATQRLEVEEAEHPACSNLRLLCADAADVAEIFAPGELDGVYLNFSDPWPKDRHAKRRLTAPAFLRKYAAVVRPGGLLAFKTDNTALFAYSLETIRESEGWTLESQTFDLHADPSACAGNVMTEYEEKFSSRGQKICRLTARRRT